MHRGISISTVAARPIAIARATTYIAKWPSEFGRTLDKVYAAVNAGHVNKGGHNIMVYYPRPDGMVDIECGIETDTPFEPVGDVLPSATPSGLAVEATHVGPYTELGSTHDAIVQWIRASGHLHSGICWEIYGDWAEDPSTLETHIVHLVRA